MSIFIDTSAFIAMMDDSDQCHKLAKDFVTKGLHTYHQITSNFIICETLNFLRTRVSYNASIQFGKNVRKCKGIKIVHITPDIEDSTWSIFKKYKDKDFSFTDCTSFIVMERLKVKTAFAFDEHFTQYGKLIVVPKI
ncbi:MAG: hypothetical protein A3D13_01835 [Planctomycetes bacterium RIFCSPHIGHO2_02_FULL_40_12]|nr:MAG: hypothetical protein A3D13_01835 [Planctomycetes bacterium RIFCSPHIGHO2_02_FULL_40_12]